MSNSSEPSWKTACGVSYASLVVTYFGIGAPLRDALSDLAADHLPPALGAKAQELLECSFCVSFWAALVAAKGRPVKAAQLAGMASVVTSAVLIATKD